MMKHYGLALMNNITGELDHVATSQGPLQDNRVGQPEGYETTHTLVRFEFESTDGSFIKARQVLESVKLSGGLPAGRIDPAAILEVRSASPIADKIVNIIKERKPNGN